VIPKTLNSNLPCNQHGKAREDTQFLTTVRSKPWSDPHKPKTGNPSPGPLVHTISTMSNNKPKDSKLPRNPGPIHKSSGIQTYPRSAHHPRQTPKPTKNWWR